MSVLEIEKCGFWAQLYGDLKREEYFSFGEIERVIGLDK